VVSLLTARTGGLFASADQVATVPAESNCLGVHRECRFQETADGQRHLDVFEPPECGPKPAVLFVHGGGSVIGRKGELASYALEFADRGYVAVTSQDRLADTASFPAALVDVKAAIAWLRTEARPMASTQTGSPPWATLPAGTSRRSRRDGRGRRLPAGGLSGRSARRGRRSGLRRSVGPRRLGGP
jgi:acetyl esterase/lipase